MFQISVSLQSEVVVSWAGLCWGWVGDQWSFWRSCGTMWQIHIILMAFCQDFNTFPCNANFYHERCPA